MAKICICCGQKIPALSIVKKIIINKDDFVVCGKCFDSINNDIAKLKENLSDEAIAELRESNRYNKFITDHIVKTVQETTQEEKVKIIKDECKLTNGFSFEGYKIDKYCGIISGETVLGTGFLSELSSAVTDTFGVRSGMFGDKMKLAKKYALDDMIKECTKTGGNAIIGINFQVVTFSNNSIGVSVNGTSVKISKIE